MSELRTEPSHYDVLQLRSDASPDEIRLAWRRLARQHHSDHGGGGGDDAAMQRINRAYEVLSSPHERAQYDISRRPPRPAGAGRFGLARSGGLGWTLAGLGAAAAVAVGAVAATLLQGSRIPAARPQLASGSAEAPDAPLSLVPARQLQSRPIASGQARP